MSTSLDYLIRTLTESNRIQTIAILRGVGFSVKEIRDMLPAIKRERTTWLPPTGRFPQRWQHVSQMDKTPKLDLAFR
jgi:DNA-binding transcriptional MerR regulator